MRIAMLSADSLSADGGSTGVGINIVGLASALKGLGADVHLFGPEAGRRSHYATHSGLHYHAINPDGYGDLEPNLALRELAQAAVYYLCATEGVAGPFDVVHVHHAAFFPVLGEIRARTGARAFLSVHTIGQLEPSNAFQKLEWLPSELVEKVIASSQAILTRAMEVLGLPTEKGMLVYPGVEFRRCSKWVDQAKVKARYGCGPLEPLVLHPGEISRRRGCDVLLEAAFEARQVRGDLKIVFAGDGPLLPYLRERSAVLGIAGATRFLGMTGEDQLTELYNACDLVCLPAREGTADRYVLEAWCAGKPVLVTKAAQPEFVRPGQDCIAADIQPQVIASSIVDAFADSIACRDMGRRGWARAEGEFAWESVAKRILRTYRETLNQGGGTDEMLVLRR